MKKKSKRRTDAPYAKKRKGKPPVGKRKVSRTPRVRRESETVYDIKGRPVDMTGSGSSTSRGHRGELTGKSFEGVFRSGGGKYGFVTSEEGGEDFFIPPPYVGGALNGDRVTVRRLVERDGRGRGSEAAVIDVIERARDYIIGTLKTDGFYVWVESDDRSVCGEVTSFTVAADIGDKVELRILRYPDRYKTRKIRARSVTLSLSGEVTANYGECESREANYMSILRENSIPTEFPDEVITEAQARSTDPVTTDDRADLRNQVIFTIDGAGAKDLDDAISIERTSEGYLLGVHIADVSRYVTANSALDKEALARGTSVYFIDKVVPMLPKELSNGSCSLNAGEDKYALSAFIRLSGEGEIVGYKFEKSVIRSVVRGVYSEVNDLLEKGDISEFAEKYDCVRPSLEIMYELYRILSDKAKARGVLELDAPEAEIVMGEDGLPAEVIPRVRGDAERIIEQFMLCANIAAASFMEGKGLPGVYRIHQSPDPDKIRSLVLFAHNLGLDVSPLGEVHDAGVDLTRTVRTIQLQKVLEEATEKGIGEIVSSVMLRSMMKAKYQGSPSPHFGLGVPLYAHFTSPIRRYPDLFIHRVISAHLADKRPPSFERAQNAALMSSRREIAAQTAERQIEALYMTLWMSQHLGEIFDGQITGVCQSGIFVRTAMLCEGFVPEEELGRIIDYNENTLTLRVATAEGKVTFTLGDKVRVAAVEADVITRRITFSLCESET